MSFSADLDAVRERAGINRVFRIECRGHHRNRPERLITIDEQRATRFLDQHASPENGMSSVVTYLEGPGRFQVRRLYSVTMIPAEWPWVVRDAERPRTHGWARTHAAAIKLVDLMMNRPGEHVQVLDDDDEVVAYVSGRPRTKGGVGTSRIHAPCHVIPVLNPESDACQHA